MNSGTATTMKQDGETTAADIQKNKQNPATGTVYRVARMLVVLTLHAIITSSNVRAQEVIDMNDGAALCAATKARFAPESSIFAGKGVSMASVGFDATYYHLDLDVDPAAVPVLSGRIRITGRLLTALSTMDLDLKQNMTVDSVRTPNGAMLSFSHAGNELSIDLGSTVPAGSDVSVDVYYRGSPDNNRFDWYVDYTTNSTHGSYFWTLSEPYGARYWWPNKDHPADKADSVRITVRVPSNLRVGSNGLLESETDNGDGTTTFDWMHRYPISSYLISLAIGEYDVYEQTYVRPDSLAAVYGSLSLPILHYPWKGSSLFDGISASEPNGWKRVLEALPVLEYWFGPYPFPEEKYGHASFTFGGGMEHQTMSSLGNLGLGLITHELAHMWYGDAVTNRTWPHLWLHEGFATASEMLFWEARKAEPAYGARYDLLFSSRFNQARKATGSLVLSDTTSVANMFNGNRIYAKGWTVLRMLRHIVGDEKFRTILQTFAADPALRYGVAETADFQRIAENISGKDLSAFFHQWVLIGTGYPQYEAVWSDRSNVGNHAVQVTLKQVQSLEQSQPSNILVFKMPVDILVRTSAGDVRTVVEQTERTQSFNIVLEGTPLAVLVDPDTWILRNPEVSISVATESGPEVPESVDLGLSLYPNPVIGQLTMDLTVPVAGVGKIRLYDITGREVYNNSLGLLATGMRRRTASLPDQLPAGVYLVEVSVGKALVRGSVSILH